MYSQLVDQCACGRRFVAGGVVGDVERDDIRCESCEGDVEFTQHTQHRAMIQVLVLNTKGGRMLWQMPYRLSTAIAQINCSVTVARSGSSSSIGTVIRAAATQSHAYPGVAGSEHADLRSAGSSAQSTPWACKIVTLGAPLLD